MKRASLVFFYFGDSPFITIAQETVPVGMALEGYDRSVLLHFETKIGPFHISASDEKCANVVEAPTAENLKNQLIDLRKGGYMVDLFLFGHGSDRMLRVSTGRPGRSSMVSADWFDALVPGMDMNIAWQCQCWGASWNRTWAKIGAKASAGSRSVNFYPNRFRRFIREWKDGASFSEAISRSDTEAVHTASQTWMVAQAVARNKEWGGSAFQASTVLGKNNAAESYFRTCWLGDEWVSGKSGKENMNIASEMIILGDGSTRR